MLKILPNAKYIADISEYAVSNCKPEIKKRLKVGNTSKLPWPDNSFDLVISITTLHNLHNYDLEKALAKWSR